MNGMYKGVKITNLFLYHRRVVKPTIEVAGMSLKDKETIVPHRLKTCCGIE